MIKESYKENNRLKERAWLVVPLGILIVGIIALFGNSTSIAPTSKIIEQSNNGMRLELSVISTDKSLGWQADWVPASSVAKQQVAQSLSQFHADFKQLRPQLLISVQPDSSTRDKLTRRLGEALAQHDLGKVDKNAPVPMTPESSFNSGIVLYCSEADSAVARRLLAALTPFIGGHVSIHYDNDINIQSMRLYLYGVPFFNNVGQATFDSTQASGSL